VDTSVSTIYLKKIDREVSIFLVIAGLFDFLNLSRQGQTSKDA
jgi:hypothetical protein